MTYVLLPILLVALVLNILTWLKLKALRATLEEYYTQADGLQTQLQNLLKYVTPQLRVVPDPLEELKQKIKRVPTTCKAEKRHGN